MPKPGTLFEVQAREAADRIEAARAAGEQLALPLPDESRDGSAGRGRGAGKATSQMRDWLASRGYRMPEDVLAELAGLSTGEDAFMAAMLRAEQVLTWASRDAAQATPAQRIDTFKFVMTAMLRAGEALLPYGLTKLSPETPAAAPVQVIVQQGSTPAVRTGPDQARDVTPAPRRIAPPPMPGQIVENQSLSRSPVPSSDGRSGDDGASA